MTNDGLQMTDRERKFLCVFCVGILLFSCRNNSAPTNIDSVITDTQKAKLSSIMKFRIKMGYHIPTAGEIDSIEKISAPVKGYRFVIKGDFDGDGIKETLTEHFYSKKLNRETYKFYDSLHGYDLIGLNSYKKPRSFMTCSTKKMDTLTISDSDWQMGLSFMKNEGDLNGDGGDEISYVVNLADFSNCNRCYIKTWKNGEWKELFSFPVWDWQFPQIPDAYTQYGLFGTASQSSVRSDDSLTKEQLKEFKEFPGLIKKMKSGKTRIEYMGEGAELDTMYVRMDTIKLK
jgi:hypothetical protein